MNNPLELAARANRISDDDVKIVHECVSRRNYSVIIDLKLGTNALKYAYYVMVHTDNKNIYDIPDRRQCRIAAIDLRNIRALKAVSWKTYYIPHEEAAYMYLRCRQMVAFMHEIISDNIMDGLVSYDSCYDDDALRYYLTQAGCERYNPGCYALNRTRIKKLLDTHIISVLADIVLGYCTSDINSRDDPLINMTITYDCSIPAECITWAETYLCYD